MLELHNPPLYTRVIVVCDAPEAVLRKPIVERVNDPWEANLQVFEQQINKRGSISAEERILATIVRIDAGKIHRLRGIYARVTRDGIVNVGDEVRKL